MPYVLVPRAVEQKQATIWIGAFDEPEVRATLKVGARSWSVEAWRDYADDVAFRWQTVDVPLEGKGMCPVELDVGGVRRAVARVRALPDRLPSVGERPFTVMLGSCFHVGNDPAGLVGRTWLTMPTAARPDLKLLCGDQVYLDAPWSHFLFRKHDRAELRASFVATYRKTWTQRAPGFGFAHLLADGANCFCSDDHELWNNAPNRAPLVRDSWTRAGQESWCVEAKALYRVLQNPNRTQKFAVGKLSFFVADTRMDRALGRTRFMADHHLDELANWVAGLTGPGVLVVGQPIFQGRTGVLKGTLGDWNIVDYEQYERFAQILAGTRRSLLVLTGDVHFGRIARCTVPTGAEIIEVISSPLTLVNPAVAGKWKPANGFFPAIPCNVPRVAVTTERFQVRDNHFLTLEFSDKGRAVAVTVRVWSIEGARSGHRGEVVFRRDLY